MATFVPKNLIGPSAALTSVVTTYVSPVGTNGIIRTIHVSAPTTGITLTVSLGADAAATRIISGMPLSPNFPYTLNCWLVTAANSAHAIDASSNATGTNCICNISGYEVS